MTRKAFSLLELVLSILILGIIGVITLNATFSIYLNYIQTKAITSLENETELTLDKIAKRLSYRIKNSVITRKSSNPSVDPLILSNLGTITDQVLLSKYDVLEWVGYDFDNFTQENYNGFITLDKSTKRQIQSNGNNKITEISLYSPQLDKTQIYKNLNAIHPGFNGVDFPLFIYFQDVGDSNNALEYYGFSRNGDKLIPNTAKLETDKILLNPIYENEVSSRYYLAHSAYAIYPMKKTDNDTDFVLYLRYNYQPWMGSRPGNQSYDAGTKSIKIAEHVTNFVFRQRGDLLELKLCIRDAGRSGLSFNNSFDPTICKTKVVY